MPAGGDARSEGLAAPEIGDRRIRVDAKSRYDGHTYEVARYYNGIIELRWLRPDGTLTPLFPDGPWILFDRGAWHNQFREES